MDPEPTAENCFLVEVNTGRASTSEHNGAGFDEGGSSEKREQGNQPG